ncbi:hypothetical protein PV04_07659 [Phialophora macrospora]|uniref:GrpB family protein n=1 Tax=Phialophora macrospora TaxID=1851006 RepID=A0A0D2CJI1_9EURO|nr:hypothetical protein PV04_07659 [Phialophora macrospora]
MKVIVEPYNPAWATYFQDLKSELEEILHGVTYISGYAYMGEMGIPDRHAFRKPGVAPTRNLYVSVRDCQSIRNQLGVRDICRRDTAVRDAYGRKKLELSQQEWRNVDEYCEAKNEIIAWILEKAGVGEEEREEIRRLNKVTGAEGWGRLPR